MSEYVPMTPEEKIKWAIEAIQHYYLKNYGVPKENYGFLNAVIYDVDKTSWNAGYDDAKEDGEINY